MPSESSRNGRATPPRWRFPYARESAATTACFSATSVHALGVRLGFTTRPHGRGQVVVKLRARLAAELLGARSAGDRYRGGAPAPRGLASAGGRSRSGEPVLSGGRELARLAQRPWPGAAPGGAGYAVPRARSAASSHPH